MKQLRGNKSLFLPYNFKRELVVRQSALISSYYIVSGSEIHFWTTVLSMIFVVGDRYSF